MEWCYKEIEVASIEEKLCDMTLIEVMISSFTLIEEIWLILPPIPG